MAETIYSLIILFLFLVAFAVCIAGQVIQTSRYKEWLRAKIIQEEGNKRFWR